MATLTETAYYTRRGINWAIIVFIAYFILRILWSGLFVLFVVLFPPKKAVPDHIFNKLPALVFPQAESSPSSQLTFSLETISGSLPSASDSARVYFMPKPAANLLAISKTQQFAQQLGFSPTYVQESRTVYRFDDPESPIRKLRYDIVSKNFILKYAFEQDTSVFTERRLQNPEIVKEEAINFLQEKNLYDIDFQNGNKVVTYYKLVGNALVPVENISQNDAMRVDFFRRSINTLSLKTPNPMEGQISILFSGASQPKRHILEVVYTLWPIDESRFGTYPIKSAQAAWTELQSGRGYVAQYPSSGQNTATIRKVYLAYYDSYDPQTYLQPLFVFEGDYGFTAYVPAILPEWIE